jgi:hypothetical protein
MADERASLPETVRRKLASGSLARGVHEHTARFGLSAESDVSGETVPASLLAGCPPTLGMVVGLAPSACRRTTNALRARDDEPGRGRSPSSTLGMDPHRAAASTTRPPPGNGEPQTQRHPRTG